MRLLPALLLLAAPAYGQVNAVQPRAVVPSVADNQQKELTQLRARFNDYGQLARYAQADAALSAPAAGEKRVVFFGDSITDSWRLDQFFPGKPYVNRGISGQTTPQMLVRYWQDVLNLHPAAVVILAGTNDLSGNSGPETIEQIEADFQAFATLARAHGIKLILSSVTPVSSYGKAGQSMLDNRPPAKILELNGFLKQLCSQSGSTYLNYYPAMVDSAGMLKRELSDDGLHPNAAGYAVMAPMAEKAIESTLAR